ncbi:MAG: S1 RNA-binding domain-containing protein [Bradymonadia bacterium]
MSDTQGPEAQEPSRAPVFVHPTVSLADLIERIDWPVKPGQILAGKITAIADGLATVTLADHGEYTGSVPAGDLSVDDAVQVYVEDVDGTALELSLGKAERLSLWERLHDARKSGRTVQATGLAVIRGGLSVDVGLKATLPSSQAARAPGQRLEDLIGETFEVKITRMDERKGVVQVSRKALSAPAPRAERDEADAPEGTEPTADLTADLTAPEEGTTIEGTVARLAKFGAFVELGGYEGLLHVNDMSWGRVNRPEDVVQVGDALSLKVVSVKDFDQPKKRRIKLSLKENQADPWTEVDAEQYPADARLTGTVVGLTDFGAFVEIAPGLEGMVHISEMSWTDHVKHPRERVTVGEQLEVKVLQCDPARRRLSLSLKLTENNPWHGLAERYPVGTRIKGEVARITRFGLFVAIEEGIDGLVHTRDLSWVPGSVNPKTAYSPGTAIEALVLNVDEEAGKVALGIKQLTPDNSAEIYGQFAEGQRVEGEITNIREFGVFVALAPGIEGLLHRSEMGDGVVKRPRDHFKKGQKITVKVLSVDVVAGKVGLTLKGEEGAIQAATPAEAPADADAPAEPTVEAPAAAEASAAPENAVEASPEPAVEAPADAPADASSEAPAEASAEPSDEDKPTD